MLTSSAASAESTTSCPLCDGEFSAVTRLRHKCRSCGIVVCSQCSGSRYRLSPDGPKERVCDICARDLRESHAEELEESADVRQQINESLKQLLKEKYEKIEEYKVFLLNLIHSEPYLQEPPTSLDSPSRFSAELGASRINFSQLVDYFDERVKFLKNKTREIEETISRDSEELSERRRNFEFLKDRTDKAEIDATRTSELVHQRNRLKEIFRDQSVSIRALQDRAEILENQQLSTGIGGPGNLLFLAPPPVDSVGELEFIGDKFVAKIFPCL